ncbi:MAG: hypothetical protein ACXVCR_18735 [Bdellovibrio sp.]
MQNQKLLFLGKILMLFMAQVAFANSESLSLNPGEYETSKALCDVLISFDPESGAIILENIATKEYNCDSGSFGYFNKKNNGLYQFRNEKKLNLKDIFDCTGTEKNRRLCIDKFYDKEDKLIVKNEDVYAGKRDINILNKNSFILQPFQYEISRNGVIISQWQPDYDSNEPAIYRKYSNSNNSGVYIQQVISSSTHGTQKECTPKYITCPGGGISGWYNCDGSGLICD